MCVGCPDFVDMCTEGNCHNPDGGPYGKYAKFYLGDEYCEHLKEKYGHSHALYEDMFGEDDE